jgi:hypothetical protein
VLVPDAFLELPMLLSVSLLEAGRLLAYGPAPGMELIPYFLALLGWVGLAFFAILMAPLSALLRRIRRNGGRRANHRVAENTEKNTEKDEKDR